MESLLRVGARVPVTEVEGPGARYALWVAGCSIRCPGCCNPHLFDAAGGEAIAVSALLEEIRAVRPRIEGLTLLGGEPFEQAAGLAALAEGAHELGLSVMTFTGFTLEALRARADFAVDALLAATDVLVDGPYVAHLPDARRRWVGSANQRFHYLTDRSSPDIELPAHSEPLRAVEFRVSPDGRVLVNGWPELIADR